MLAPASSAWQIQNDRQRKWFLPVSEFKGPKGPTRIDAGDQELGRTQMVATIMNGSEIRRLECVEKSVAPVRDAAGFDALHQLTVPRPSLGTVHLQRAIQHLGHLVGIVRVDQKSFLELLGSVRQSGTT